MKLHKRLDHSTPGVSYWGKRSEVHVRINFGDFQQDEIFSAEPLHFHTTRTTYFCVLFGSMIVEVEDKEFVVTKEAMLEVSPKERYRVVSMGKEGCKWVVVGSHNEDDRVEIGND